MYSITANGLEPTKEKDFTDGRVYLFGASSSPKKAYVVASCEEFVTYVDLQSSRHHEPRLVREQRPIFADLVRRAEDTVREKKEQMIRQHGDTKGEELWKVHYGQYIDGGPLSKTLGDIVEEAKENGLANA